MERGGPTLAAGGGVRIERPDSSLPSRAKLSRRAESHGRPVRPTPSSLRLRATRSTRSSLRRGVPP